MKQFYFIVAIFIAIMIGGHIAAWTFFGLLTFAGFVGLVESIPLLKWIIYRTSQLFDFLIFGLTIAATVKLGVTITASLTIAGLAFTFVYRPYIASKRAKNTKKKYKL